MRPSSDRLGPRWDRLARACDGADQEEGQDARDCAEGAGRPPLEVSTDDSELEEQHECGVSGSQLADVRVGKQACIEQRVRRPCCFGAAEPASGARQMPSHAHARAWRRPAPCLTAPRHCLQVLGALHPAAKQVRPPSPHNSHAPPAACTRSGPGGPARRPRGLVRAGRRERRPMRLRCCLKSRRRQPGLGAPAASAPRLAQGAAQHLCTAGIGTLLSHRAHASAQV